MNENKIIDIIVEAAKHVFKDANNISITSSSRNTPGWDSLGNVNLIMEIEERFNVEFDEDDMLKATSLEAIHKIVTKHISRNPLKGTH